MKPRLLDHPRCPECFSTLRLDNPLRGPGHPEEILGGSLACTGCSAAYPVRSGVPSFVERSGHDARTRSSFGYLWTQSAKRGDPPQRYHLEQMRDSLPLPPLKGLVLDAGCGEGIDLVNASKAPGAELIGVELSDGGAQVSFERAAGYPAAHVVQADLARLPFAPETFDFIYSYGVLHHMPDPAAGMRELSRALKPGASAAIYLYEDFSDRRGLWRWLLAAVNRSRAVTTVLPHRLLYALCAAGSPLVWLLFTVPHTLLNLLPPARGIAASFPFRHGTGPFSLTGDLYDRFSAPVEKRYNSASAVSLLKESGLEQVATRKNRGWMLLGNKPNPVPGTSYPVPTEKVTTAAL